MPNAARANVFPRRVPTASAAILTRTEEYWIPTSARSRSWVQICFLRVRCRYAPPDPFRRFISGKKRLDPQFLKRDILRRAERHDRAEHAQLEGVLPNVNGQQQIARGRRRKRSRACRAARVAAKLGQQREGRFIVLAGAEFPLRSTQETCRNC